MTNPKERGVVRVEASGTSQAVRRAVGAAALAHP